MLEMSIGERMLGPGHPAFVVVETGTTCNGDLETALRMVDASVEAGADAIKFQLIGPDFFMSSRDVSYTYETADGVRTENMYEMLKGLELGPDEWRAIRDRCAERGIVFYATVDHLPGVELAESLGVPAYKLSSWDLTNVPLIRAMAATGKPVQVDLGPAHLADVERVVEHIRAEGNEQIVLVHCSHALDDEGINVRSIPYLESTFGVPVGYSADSRDFVPDLAAVALGARLIEKRLTLDRTHPGHHHVKAVEPAELAEWIRMVRRTEAVLGSWALVPSAEDMRQRELYFVSVVANGDIRAGETITAEMLACKRPGHGISPEQLELLVGRTATRDIARDELLTWDVV